MGGCDDVGDGEGEPRLEERTMESTNLTAELTSRLLPLRDCDEINQILKRNIK